ncbi:hypothetical protein SJAV_27280 [Sulfurisphaera javensis]|uniref:Uncharacterized protein n=1 Tax=Sulfurisphaera javensis TaxID=2049879 RepID=A0AAT9GVF2_9CREN
MKGALRDSITEAISIAKEEINNAIERKSWRKKALKLMVYGANWSLLERETKVSSETLSSFLDKLERLHIVEKKEKVYIVTDPVYRKAILNL